MNKENTHSNCDGKPIDEAVLEALAFLGIEGAKSVVFFRPGSEGPRLISRLKDCPSRRAVALIDPNTGLRLGGYFYKPKGSYCRESKQYGLFPVGGSPMEIEPYDGELIVETWAG